MKSHPGWLLPLLLLVACHAGQKPAPTQPSADDGVELWLGGDVHLGAARAPLPTDLGPLGIINFEGPIGPDADRSSESKLINAPESAAALKNGGVLIASIANNHANDLGADGIKNTITELERANIQPIGAERVGLIRAKDLTIAVTAHDLSNGIPPSLEKDLQSARQSADALIATFHVFAPHGYLPPKELKEAVKLALAAGAQVVAAHGTHHLARVNRLPNAVVAYGLGNLAFACDCGVSDEGLILKVRLSKHGVGAAELIPMTPGTADTPPRPSANPNLEFDLLESLGSSKLTRAGHRATF